MLFRNLELKNFIFWKVWKRNFEGILKILYMYGVFVIYFIIMNDMLMFVSKVSFVELIVKVINYIV